MTLIAHVAAIRQTLLLAVAKVNILSNDNGRAGRFDDFWFSGIGGFDLGLERAGMTCMWQVEKDKKKRVIRQAFLNISSISLTIEYDVAIKWEWK